VVVGSLELHPLRDAVGLLAAYAEVYPDVPAEAWGPYRALYPELFAGEDWRLPCGCFLVRTVDTTILVDTGVGPPGLWDWTAEDEGRLPAELDALGVRAEDVDVVFLTHLHIDHLGWNTHLEGVQFFPHARYVVHRDALAFAMQRTELAHIRRCVEPLASLFETVAGDVELAPGVTAFESIGHYPGHMALRLESEDARAMLLADTAVHPALLNEPDWVYAADGDPPACAETRHRLYPELVDRDVLVACGHYPGTGIGRVVTRDGRIVWEEVG
jgi:glyoxylase-like metal-dependent hydrolase (beta-lactamase superfamily II)